MCSLLAFGYCIFIAEKNNIINFMKKALSLLAVALLLGISSEAQSKRYVLFEHFTQASCGPCAVQNPVFEATVAQNEGKYHHLAYHTSWPGTDPMYNVNPAEVDTRVGYYNVTGVPRIQMLGTIWGGQPGGVSSAQIDVAASTGAPLRLDVSFVDNGDDTHTASVVVNETGVIEGSNLKLRIAVVERVIDYTTPPGSNGEITFPNVFRLMPSTTDGIGYTPTGIGTSQLNEVTYDVNEAWNLDEIYVLAWLQDDSGKEILNSGSSDDPSWEVVTETSTLAGGTDPINFDANVFTTGIDEEIQVSYSSDQPLDWSAGIVVDGIVYTEPLVDVMLESSDTQVGLLVTPGTTAAIANYTLEITSTTYPDDPIATITYTVVAGITDLVVDHGGEATQWNVDYTSGLALAGNTSYGVLPIGKFIAGMNDGELDEVINVYDNVSWTFPGLTEPETAVLANFLDAGGNLFVNGQDLGWDTFENEGTPITQAFYTDYLRADFQADGSGSNNQLTWTGDIVFDGIENSSIINVYGGANIYPDEFDPIDPAVAIYKYNGNYNKTGAIRVAENGHKVVYVGVDLGMIADEDVRHQLIQVSHDWFYGVISSLEYDLVIKDVLGQNYPNPAQDVTTIPLTQLDTDAYITVIDLQGRIVAADRLVQNSVNYLLDVSSLNSGIYQYYLSTENGRSETISFEVLK
jgi:hypothetical protein